MQQSAFSFGAADWIEKARATALYLAASDGEVTIDRVLQFTPRPDWVSVNATGSVFRDKRFKCVGFTKTSKVSGHARIIKIWALNGA